MTWLFLALFVAAAVAAVRRAKPPMDQWRALASRRGGVFIDAADLPAIEIDVNEARVRLQVDVRPTVPDRALVCRARWAVPSGPIFHIDPGRIGAIDELLGAEDLELGLDREFDERFIVTTNDLEATRRVWSPRAIQLLLELGQASIRSDGREIDLGRYLSDSPAVPEAMIDLVGEIAGADLFGVQALRTLPGATYHPPTGPWTKRTTPRAVVAQPVPVTLMPVVVDGRVVTRATVGDGPRVQRIEIIVREDGTLEPADGLAQIPLAAATLVHSLGNGTLVIAGADTSFTWRSVETRTERLLAGARLLAMLASGPALGAYR